MKQRPNIAPGQVWEVRGWTQTITILVLDHCLQDRLDEQGYYHKAWKWRVLNVDTGKVACFWDDWADDSQFVTRIV